MNAVHGADPQLVPSGQGDDTASISPRIALASRAASSARQKGFGDSRLPGSPNASVHVTRGKSKVQCRNGPASFSPVATGPVAGRQAAARKNGTPDSLPLHAHLQTCSRQWPQGATLLTWVSTLAPVRSGGIHPTTTPAHPQFQPQPPSPPRLRVRCSRNCRSVQRATLGSHLVRSSAPKRPPMHDRRQPVASRWPESSSSRLQRSGRGLPTSGGDDFVRSASAHRKRLLASRRTPILPLTVGPVFRPPFPRSCQANDVEEEPPSGTTNKSCSILFVE